MDISGPDKDNSKTNRFDSEKTEANEPDTKSRCLNAKNIKILVIMISIFVIIAIVALCIILIKIKKKNEEEKYVISYKEPEENKYILTIYNSQKGIPLRLFNPSRIGLDEQNYTIDEIGPSNTTRRLREVAITDGVIVPEETKTIQIKINFNYPLTNLDFMFEGCSNLVKINLAYLNSPNITSMIYTFTNCISLETVDFTSFTSSYIENMDFLFSGCTSLVNIKGFENLNTSSVQKTAGMFLECKNLISVNLSAFYFENITEPNGMFIDNPSLEIVDFGNITDITGLFSSIENFKVTIITSSINVNTSGLKGVFSVISREADKLLNCSIRNWTDFLMNNIDIKEITKYLPKNFTDIINHYEDYYLGKNLYDELMKVKYIDCNILNDTFLNFINYSECERYKRLYIDFLTEHEKCVECDDEEGRSMYCKKCSKGYYLPKGIDYPLTRCRRCDEGCVECISDNETDKSICLRCREYNNAEYEYGNEDISEYRLYNGKCYKKCEIGNEEKCKTCDEDGKYDECLSCNEGYYFDINYNKSICRKIEIDNCIQAIKEYDNVNCIKCIDGYIAHDGKCEKACELGQEGNTCASCNQTYEFKDSCSSCHPGYYLLPNDVQSLCSNCSKDSLEKNCIECEYISGEIQCLSCDSHSFLADGKCIISCTENCLNCSFENEKYICDKCQDHFFLKEIGEGKICQECPDECISCISENICTECIEEYKLIDGHCEKYCSIGPNEQCKSCDFDEKDTCKECNFGYYLPNNITNKSICNSCGQNCISCYGDENEAICIECVNEFYVLNNKSCSYCGSPRIKKCHQENEYNITIDECYSDYILFKNRCIEKCNISNYLSKCSVCNEEYDKLYQCRQCKEGYYLPNDLDNITCYYCPNNCKSCEGTEDNPICTECYDGYILSGGKCLLNCTVGNNELCKSCSTDEGNVDKCYECNDGYYLSNNVEDQKQCHICPDNCQSCTDIEYNNPNCTKCDTGYYLAKNEINRYSYYYNPIIFYRCLPCNITGCTKYKPNSDTCICIECDSSETERIKYGNINNEYISCYGRCEIGELDKCKTCGNNIGECGSCNGGYFLNSNRKCVINFHMFAKYKTTKVNEYVKFMKSVNILNMTINGTSVENPKYYYNFPRPGEHLVYIKFYSSISFCDLFKGITHLTYIEFLPKAKGLYIGLMNDCFQNCINLEYADLSNLNLKNNGCFMNFFSGDKKLKEVKFPTESFGNAYYYYGMFYGCESLTSINMSNVHNTRGQPYYNMFYGCKNLKYLNLEGFDNTNCGYNMNNMFINVPKDAEIIIHRNFYNCISGQLYGFNRINIKN